MLDDAESDAGLQLFVLGIASFKSLSTRQWPFYGSKLNFRHKKPAEYASVAYLWRKNRFTT
ncbi:hypothetical protein [Bifidobacterium sp. ESL0745]|uniref:hypothetical protein n=1 Tax=Bifidobacterium sp. ESL0745 TaxID=2983226 RepID=UPI0023F9FC49|nr:hypothetical protein [Bifidobacterium sp. ESL0745]MDF7665982.1 hypothetical protein [Bifidobacterium sp. ESL0745]